MDMQEKTLDLYNATSKKSFTPIVTNVMGPDGKKNPVLMTSPNSAQFLNNNTTGVGRPRILPASVEEADIYRERLLEMQKTGEMDFLS